MRAGDPTATSPFAPLKAAPDTKELNASLAALNRSAERLQTLWFTFFGTTIYFAISALTTTHMQLLLEEPIQLPIVNLQVPLLAFFTIAPAFFVVIHVYLLMMLVLLARTSQGFEAQLQKAVPALGKQEAYRLRVENALFLQLLSGMEEERRGKNGWVLAGIALVTLAVAPLLVLLLFQFMFLPYQHFALTWWHRILVVVDLLAVLALWSAYRRGDGMVSARGALADWGRQGWMGRGVSVTAVLAACYVSVFEGRWAGEPKPWTCRYQETIPELRLDVVCPMEFNKLRFISQEDGVLFGLFQNRLVLPGQSIVSQNLLDQKTADARAGGGDGRITTQDFSWRKFVRAYLSNSDLMFVNLFFIDQRFQNL